MAPTQAIAEETRDLGGVTTFLRRTEGEGTLTVFAHGNPTHSADWIPFLEACSGPAIAMDMPNFGRSERVPPERFDASMDAYGEWIGAAIDELGINEFNLVVHDWGAVGLLAAQHRSERVMRIVVINAVPFLPGYRWHWVAQIWRRRLIGPALNRTTSRRSLGLVLRQARPGFRPMPPGFVEMVWEGWDRKMAAAVLRLYRSADPAVLEAAGADLGRLGCPALVIWGHRDPYLPARFGRAYAECLPQAELDELGDAGHWPWIDRPEVVARVAGFLR